MEYPETNEEFEEFIYSKMEEINNYGISESEKQILSSLIDKIGESYEATGEILDNKEPFMYLGQALETICEAVKRGRLKDYMEIVNRIVENSHLMCYGLRKVWETLNVIEDDKNILERKLTVSTILENMRNQKS